MLAICYVRHSRALFFNRFVLFSCTMTLFQENGFFLKKKKHYGSVIVFPLTSSTSQYWAQGINSEIIRGIIHKDIHKMSEMDPSYY